MWCVDQGGMGDADYLAAFQQIVMPVAYEVCVYVFCILTFSASVPITIMLFVLMISLTF